MCAAFRAYCRLFSFEIFRFENALNGLQRVHSTYALSVRVR